MTTALFLLLVLPLFIPHLRPFAGLYILGYLGVQVVGLFT